MTRHHTENHSVSHETGTPHHARVAAARLLLFRGVLDSASGHALLQLLDLLDRQPADYAGKMLVAEAYGRLFAALARAVGPPSATEEHDEVPAALVPPDEPNAWRAYVVARLLGDDNPFTRAAQRGAPAELAPALRDAAIHDLRLLQELAALDGDVLAAAAGEASDAPVRPVSWAFLRSLPPMAPERRSDDTMATERHSSADEAGRLLLASDDWGARVDDVAGHVARHGTGALAGHAALRWARGRDGCGRLVPVAAPDPVGPRDLIGYDEQRRALAENTERLLAGLPANDVLLFGARGTGKSSSVKALLPAYAERGLRLVEVPRDTLDDMAAVCAALRGRPGAYILFIDDLSFEEQETGYKDLKAVLEGRLEARPPNVRVYATSNRRHLVRERFGDRTPPGAQSEAEVRAGDTAQEKLSLADRFGLVLVYTTPDQERYLQIVEGIARRRGVALPWDELRSRALRWAEWHNGRSGRTARQFVDSLAAT